MVTHLLHIVGIPVCVTQCVSKYVAIRCENPYFTAVTYIMQTDITK